MANYDFANILIRPSGPTAQHSPVKVKSRNFKRGHSCKRHSQQEYWMPPTSAPRLPLRSFPRSCDPPLLISPA